MKTKRLLPLILAAATAVGVLAGCKTGGTPAQIGRASCRERV